MQLGSFSVERETAQKVTVSGSYIYVHGEDLIRARDVNLPPPVQVTYPVFDATGGGSWPDTTLWIPSQTGEPRLRSTVLILRASEQ